MRVMYKNVTVRAIRQITDYRQSRKRLARRKKTKG